MINSLALGFRLLTNRLELLIVPIALSILIFLLPPVDLSAHLEDLDVLLEQILVQSSGLEGAGTELDTQSASLLTAYLQDLDLSRIYVGDLILTFGRYFFRVPTYISGSEVQGLGPMTSLALSSPVEILGMAVFLLLLGAVAGSFYLYWLARFVPDYNQEEDTVINLSDHTAESMFGGRTVTLGRCIGQGLLYVGVLIAIWFGTAFAISLFLTVLSLVVGLGGILASLLPFLSTIMMVAAILFVFYQTYVTAGIMMDGLSVWPALRQSVQLVRQNVLSTLAFLLLGGFILLGVQQLLDLLVTAMQDHWAGLFLAAVVFAYVGTVISLAFLVFYRTRNLKNRGYDIAEYFALQDS